MLIFIKNYVATGSKAAGGFCFIRSIMLNPLILVQVLNEIQRNKNEIIYMRRRRLKSVLELSAVIWDGEL